MRSGNGEGRSTGGSDESVTSDVASITPSSSGYKLDREASRHAYSRANTLPIYRVGMGEGPSSAFGPQDEGGGGPDAQAFHMTHSRTVSPTRFSWRAPLRVLSSFLPVGPSVAAEAAYAEQLVEEAQHREAILHQLIHALQTLIKEEVDLSRGQSLPVEIVTLRGDLPGVQELCLTVEQACFHGIKTESFHGQLPFWDLIEALEGWARKESAEHEAAGGTRMLREPFGAGEDPALEEGEEPEDECGGQIIRYLVHRVNRVTAIRTSVGKARSFLRHALHDGNLDQVMARVMAQAPAQLGLFYDADAIVLHQDDRTLLLEVLRSISDHFRLDLSGDMEAPGLDREPDWPMLHLATEAARRRREREEGKDRGILAAALLDDLTHWQLEERGEAKALETFQRSDAFNSSAKRTGHQDRVVDALLETSGVALRHVGGTGPGEGGGESGGKGEEEAEVVELVEVGGGASRPYHRLLHEQQRRLALQSAQRNDLGSREGDMSSAGSETPSSLTTPPRRRPKGGELYISTSLPSTPAYKGARGHASPRRAVTPTTTVTRLAHPNRYTPIQFSSPRHLSGLADEAFPQSPPSGEVLDLFRPASPPHSPVPISVRPAPASFDHESHHGPIILPSKEFLSHSPASRLRRPSPQTRKVFGVPLAHLVRDVETCRFAFLEPSLGVPYVFETMIGYLEAYLEGSPDLFESRVSGWRVSNLSKVLDESQEIPPGTDPSIVAATLNLALRMLPEPLLTYESYHAFLSAARVSDLALRRASISQLLHGLPWEHKPTLRKLMHLLWKACQAAEHAGDGADERVGWDGASSRQPQQYGLSSRKLAPIFARSMLRSYLPQFSRAEQEHIRQIQSGDQLVQPGANLALPFSLSHPPEAVALTQELIEHYTYYFHRAREEEEAKTRALQAKVERLAAMVETSKQPADAERDSECLSLFRTLFVFLGRVEERIHLASTVSPAPVSTRHRHSMSDAFRHRAGGSPPPASRKELDAQVRRVRSQSMPDVFDPTSSLHGEDEEGADTTAIQEAARKAEMLGLKAGVAGTSMSILPENEGEEGDSEEEQEAAGEDVPFSFDHPRWETCGFVRGDPGCELVLSGRLTLQCIVRFVRRFPCIAAEMIFQYSHHGRRGITISFPALCVQVTRLVLELLQLLPKTEGGPLSITTFAQAPYWRLLDSPRAVEEVFCFALTLVDFLHFHEALRMDAVKPHILEAKRQVSWALAQGPASVHSLWELWLALRAELRRQYRDAHRKEEEEEKRRGREESRSRMERKADEEVQLADDQACFLQADPTNDQIIYKVSRGIRSRMWGKSAILAPWQVITLERSLPEHHQDRDWFLLYSLKKHGTAMHTIFERCKDHPYSLLCVVDNDGVVFGGMATEEWRDQKDRYFGSGESFLFSFKSNKFAKYTWTRNNSYFMLASQRIGMAMGGGGHFGLYLNSDLTRGSSDKCDTFGSVTLSGEKNFEVVNIEVWGFADPTGLLDTDAAADWDSEGEEWTRARVGSSKQGVKGQKCKELRDRRPKGLAESLSEQRQYQNDNM